MKLTVDHPTVPGICTFKLTLLHQAGSKYEHDKIRSSRRPIGQMRKRFREAGPQGHLQYQLRQLHARWSVSHDLAQPDQCRRLVQRIQRREDQFFFAFDLFKSNVWIVRQPSRNLATGLSNSTAKLSRIGCGSGGSPSVRACRFPLGIGQQIGPRIGVSPARAGKHVAPVNCGLQMAEHAEGEGANIHAAVFPHDVTLPDLVDDFTGALLSGFLRPC